MHEIYVFDSTAQNPLRPVTEDSQAAPEADPQLLQAAKDENFDWMEPMFACGDSNLLYITVYKQPEKNNGLIIAFNAGDIIFSVIANTGLDLMAAASHFSSMVSNVRYGVDIFENADDGDGYEE